MRTREEVEFAKACLHDMLKACRDYNDRPGALTTSKCLEMIDWVLGGGEDFNDLLRRFQRRQAEVN